MEDINDLDASYSGITKMIDEEGYEGSFSYLFENHAYQINKLELAKEELRRAEANYRNSCTALSNFALSAARNKKAKAVGKLVRINHVTSTNIFLFEIDTSDARVELTMHEVTNFLDHPKS